MKCLCCNSEFDVRTLGRNNHWWLCMQILANETQQYTKEQFSIIIKKKFLWFDEFADKKTGEVLYNFHSTTQWSNAEFDNNFEFVKDWALSEFGITLLRRSEYIESLNDETP